MPRSYEPDPFLGVLAVVGWLLIAIAAAVVLVIAMNGCAPVEPPIVMPDAGPPPLGDCQRAEQQLEQLGCVAGSVCTDSDCDDFEERCEALEADFPGYLNLPCLVVAVDCAAVDACAE